MPQQISDLIEGYISRQQKLNSIQNGRSMYNVVPAVQDTFETKVRETSDFLKKINYISKRELKGRKITVGSGSTVAGTTKTGNGVTRQPMDPVNQYPEEYELFKTDYDTAISYETIDMWREDPRYQNRWTDIVLEQVGLDRMMTGFNGTHRVDNSDRVANPLLQDVNIGWVQKMRNHRPAAVLGTGVTVGPGGDYEHLDASVFDAKTTLIAPHLRKSPDLVVLISDDLLNEKYMDLINTTSAASERNALDILMLQQRLGQLQAYSVPYFPDRTFMITSFKNISIYGQKGGQRRYTKEEPESNRIVNYMSMNESYEIENFEKCCVYENILLPDGNGGWA